MSGREPDPFERISARLDGIRAITVLANVAIESNDVTDKVWFPIWGLIGEIADDIAEDAELLWRNQKNVGGAK